MSYIMFEGYFGSTIKNEDSKSCFDMAKTILDDMFGEVFITVCCRNKWGDFEVEFYTYDGVSPAKVMRFTPAKLEEIYNERYRK